MCTSINTSYACNQNWNVGAGDTEAAAFQALTTPQPPVPAPPPSPPQDACDQCPDEQCTEGYGEQNLGGAIAQTIGNIEQDIQALAGDLSQLSNELSRGALNTQTASWAGSDYAAASAYAGSNLTADIGAVSNDASALANDLYGNSSASSFANAGSSYAGGFAGAPFEQGYVLGNAGAFGFAGTGHHHHHHHHHDCASNGNANSAAAAYAGNDGVAEAIATNNGATAVAYANAGNGAIAGGVTNALPLANAFGAVGTAAGAADAFHLPTGAGANAFALANAGNGAIAGGVTNELPLANVPVPGDNLPGVHIIGGAGATPLGFARAHGIDFQPDNTVGAGDNAFAVAGATNNGAIAQAWTNTSSATAIASSWQGNVDVPPVETVSTPANTPVSGSGKVWGDPHFVGANGQNYDVQGTAGDTYNLLSDSGIEVNGTFQSYGNGANTIKEIGITDANHNQIDIGTGGKLSINGDAKTEDGSYLDREVTKNGTTVTTTTDGYTVTTSDGGGYLNADFKATDVGTQQAPGGIWGQSLDASSSGSSSIDTNASDFQVSGLFDNSSPSAAAPAADTSSSASATDTSSSASAAPASDTGSDASAAVSL